VADGAVVADQRAEKQREQRQADKLKSEHLSILRGANPFVFCWTRFYRRRFKIP
jgi:hypothetical protein